MLGRLTKLLSRFVAPQRTTAEIRKKARPPRTRRSSLSVEAMEDRVLLTAVPVGNYSGTFTGDTEFLATSGTYVINGPLTVNAGVTLTIGSGVNVTLADSQTLTVNGTLNVTNPATFQVGDGFSLVTSGITVNGTMAVTGTTFSRLSGTNGSNTTRILVNTGGHLTAQNSTFGWDQVALAGGSVLSAGEITNNTFNTTVFTPVAYVPLLTNNQSFQDVTLNSGDTLTTGSNVTLTRMGTVSTANLRYVINAFTVASGATLNVPSGVNMLLSDSQTMTVNGTLNLTSLGGFQVGDGFNLVTSGITVNGTMTVTGTTFSRLSGTNGSNTTRILVNTGGHLTAQNSIFGWDQVILSGGSVLSAGEITSNTFNTTLFTPIAYVPLITDNKSFQDVTLNSGDSLTTGATVSLTQMGTVSTANLRYVINAFTVASGATLNVDSGVNMLLADSQTMTVNGTFNLTSLGSFQVGDGFNLVTAGITVNGTMTINGANFSRLSGTNGSNTTRILVTSGGHLTAQNSTFGWDQVILSNGSVLNAGEIAGNFFTTTLFTPVAYVPLLTNNKSFQDVNLNSGDTLTTGATVSLTQMGTVSTANLRYVINNFTVASGATLNVVAGVNVLLADSQSMTVNGTFNLTSLGSFQVADGFNLVTAGITVNGTMAVTGTSFSRLASNGSNTTRILVSSGGHFTAQNCTFGWDQVALAGGSVLNADEITDNFFTTTLFTPMAHVPLLTNNKSFQDVAINSGDTLSSQTVSLTAMGTVTTASLRYVFNTSTIGIGATLNVTPGVNVLVGDSQTLTVAGTFNVTSPATFQIADGFNVSTVGIVVSGAMTASGTAFTRLASNGSNTTRLLVNNGGRLTLQNSTYAWDAFTLAAGSVDTVNLNAFTTQVSIDSAAAISVSANDFSAVTGSGVVATGTSSATIPLTNNYWGTTSAATIATKILDHVDDVTRPTISFNPFLSLRPVGVIGEDAAAPFFASSQSLALRATVAGPGIIVNEGSVTFTILSGATPIGTPIVVAVSGSIAAGTYTLPGGLPTGVYTIQAAYSGSANYGSSTDTSHSLTVALPTLVLSAPSATLSGGSSVTYGVTVTSAQFDPASLTLADFTLNKTGSANGTISLSGSGSQRTLTVSGVTGDGTLGVTLAAGSIADLVGNVNPSAVVSTTFAVDTTRPVVVIGAPSASVTTHGPVSFSVTVTDPNFDPATLTAADFALTGTGGVSGILSLTGTGSARTLTISSINGNGTVSVTLAENALADLAGNTNIETVSGTFSVDNTPPTVTVGNPSSSYAAVGPITFDVTIVDLNFDSTTLTAADFTLVKTGSANGTIVLTGSGISWTVTIISITGTGTLGVLLPAGFISDVVGNSNTSSTTSVVFIVDNTRPTAAFTAPSAAFAPGGSVNYTINITDVNFDVTSVTIDDFTLVSTGTATGTLLLSGSGVSLTLTVINISGDGTLGVFLAASGIADLAGNVNLSALTSTTFIVDTTRPTVVIGAPSVSIARGGPVSFTVTITDVNFDITSLTVADFFLDTSGSATGVLSLTGTGTTRTLTISSITGDGDLGITLLPGAIVDLAGNTNDLFAVSFTFIVDNSPPVVILGTPSAAITTIGPITFTIDITDVNFDVTSLTVLDVSLARTGTANGVLGLSGSGNSRTITISSITGTGTLGIVLPAGVALDLAGNANATSVSSVVFAVDNTPPTAAFAAPSLAATAGASVSYTLTVTDTNFDVTSLTLADFTLVPTGTATGTLALSGTGLSRTLTISNISGDGTLGIVLVANALADLAGNVSATAFTSATFLVDTTRPTVVLGAPAVSIAAGGPVSITVNITDVNFDAASLTLADFVLNPTGSATGVLILTGTGSSRTLTISSITGDGTLGVTLSAAALADLAGNTNLLAEVSATFLVDNTPPSVTVGSPSATLTAAGPVTLSVDVSDINIDLASLTVADFSLSKTGTANGVLAVTGAGASRTVTISSITGAGTLGVLLPAGAVLDLAGNGNAVASAVFEVDNTPPAAVFAAPSATITAGASVTYELTITDPNFDASSLTIDDFSLSPTGAAAGTLSLSGTGAARTLTVSGISGDGTLSIVLTAGAIADLVGNVNLAAVTSATFLVDTTRPTVAVGAPSVNIAAGGPVSFSVNVADANFNAASLTLADFVLNPTGTATGILSLTGTGASRTITISSLTGDGTLGVTLSAGAIADLAGNTNALAAASTTFTVDNTRPAAAFGSPSATLATTGPITFTITVTDPHFDPATLTASDLTLVKTGDANGTLALSGTGSTRTVTISGITGNGTLGVSLPAGVVADLAGNTNLPVLSSTFAVDNQAPSGQVTSLPAFSTQGDITVTWSASDAGSGVASFDVYVSVDGGSFTLWHTAVTFTTAVYAGQLGHRYGFAIVAIDNAGVRQSMPPSPQATITLDLFPVAPPVNLLDVATAIAHSAENYSNFIQQAYVKYLGRQADAVGLSGWVSLMVTGQVSDESLEAQFISSAEYTGRHGGLGAAWVEAMYQDLLGRTPAAEEVQAWLVQINAGASPYAIAFGFAISSERESQRVRQNYLTFLSREPSSEEVAAWVHLFQFQGMSNETMQAGFAASPEVFNSAGVGSSFDLWVDAAYENILQRSPTDPERSGQVATLKVPQNLATIANQLTHSDENFSNFIKAAYVKYLGRQVDATGLAGWLSVMRSGAVSDEMLEAQLVGSAEYFAAHGGQPAPWIQAMYVNLLGRSASNAEIQAWTVQVNAGASLISIAYGFAASAERESQRVANNYLTYLGRSPSSEETAAWVGLFTSGQVTNESMAAGFLASEEYFRNFAKGQVNAVQWLDVVFADLLGRSITEAEMEELIAVIK